MSGSEPLDWPIAVPFLGIDVFISLLINLCS